jgi:hypothetical protein
MGRKKAPMREREEEKEEEEEGEEEEEEKEEGKEEEDHVRGAEEEAWGDGERREVPPPEDIDSGGDDDAGGGFGGEPEGKRKRGGGGGGGDVRKSARGKNKPATAATAAIPSFTSSYRGVTYVAACRRWEARFTFNGTKTFLGTFETDVGAARAWDRKSVWCHLRGLVKIQQRGKVGSSFTEVLNFDYADYEGELDELGRMTQTEVVERLRRGEGTRGAMSSIFRGVSWVRADRRWQSTVQAQL